MGIYIVTYDLNNEGTRPPIVKSIKEYPSWAKLSESSYAIETEWAPEQIYNDLSQHLDDDDQLFVIALTAPWFGQGPAKVVA